MYSRSMKVAFLYRGARKVAFLNPRFMEVAFLNPGAGGAGGVVVGTALQRGLLNGAIAVHHRSCD